jgi:acetyltransferase-like isoleucine patch superfamily enzyme
MNTVLRYALSILPSPIKTSWMGRRGKIGRGVKIGFGSIIEARELEIGDNTKMGVGTHIVAESVKIGKRVWIGHMNQIRTNSLEMADDSEITHDVTIGGMDSVRSRLVLGKRSSIMAHSFINTTYPVTIGDDVGLGGYTKLFTHGSWQSVLDGYPIQFGPVTIEDGVWIPWDVFIMPNVVIGRGSTIGARSLITESIPPYSLAVGSPARVIRKAPEYPPKRSLEDQTQSIENILREMKEYFDWKGWVLKVERKAGSPAWLLSDRDVATPGASVARVLLSLSSDQVANSPHYIDLEKKSDTLNLAASWQREIRNFLGRFGIRTEHVGE